MTDTVLAGLAKRRAELSGEAETLRARLAQIGTDLGHLDAVIRQFDPDYDLGSIRPNRGGWLRRDTVSLWLSGASAGC